MYVPQAFRLDRTATLAFAGARGFGLVIAFDGGRPIASPLPFWLDASEQSHPRLEFHVAQANPLGSLAVHGGRWLVAVQGPDAYVSPDWYASRDQVPTWLYESAQMSGPVRVLTADEKRDHIDRLTAQFEGWLAPKPAWSVATLSPTRREGLLRAIVAIEMRIESVEGSAKLNQHKGDADHTAIVAALAGQGGDSGAIAARMREQRSHLSSDGLGRVND